MTRHSIPINYVINDGVVFDDCTTGWVKGGIGEVTQNEDLFLEGGSSLHLSTTNTETGVFAEKTINMNLKEYAEQLKIIVYTPTPSNISSFSLYFFEESWNKWFVAPYYATNFDYNNKWSTLTINIDDISTDNEASWDEIIQTIRFRLHANNGSRADIYIDSINYAAKTKAMWIPTFDDNGSELYDAFTAMENRNIKGTWYINPANIGKDGYMTETQIDEIYDAGHSISNHTIDHTDLTSLTSSEEIIEKITLVSDWFDDKGFENGREHLAYPYNHTNDLIISSLEDTEIKSARIGELGSGFMDVNIFSAYKLRAKGVTKTTLSTILSWFNYAERYGSQFIFILHGIREAPTSGRISLNDWEKVLDYSGRLQVRTIDEWYDGLNHFRLGVEQRNVAVRDLADRR